MIIVVWWAFGCLPSSTDWNDAFEKSPEQVVLDLQELVNPTERLAIVESLQREFPGQTAVLCSALDSSAQEYCLERNKRPHLWMPLKEHAKENGKGQGTLDAPQHVEGLTDVGKTQSNIQKIEQVAGSLDYKVDNLDSDCRNVSCRITNALPLAYRGQIQMVSNMCSLSTITESHECLFATAEKVVAERGVLKYDTAVEICLLAKSFSDNCQNHLLQQLAKRAPDADTTSDWGTIVEAHRALETTWGWRDQETKESLQHRLWSEALGMSYAGADRIVGNPLDTVPSQYHCHVYSAAAWRLFQLEEPSTHDLQAWVDTLQNYLAKRSSKAESFDQQRRFRAASNLWGGESRMKDDIVIPYLSTSHRLKGKDESTEVTLAILEAIARQPPVQYDILEAGVLDERSEVQRTAQRLLAQQPSSDN